MRVEEVKCKSIMSDSGIYGVDYAINPYVGCEHDCKYCYAKFMSKFTDHAEPWGEFVDVKTNSRAVLQNDLMDNNKGSILLSSVTDPYQPVEEEYELTRDILKRLSDTSFPVSILTKSSLITRDLDVLKSFNPGRLDVGFTLNFLDDADRGIWEPNSSAISERIEALEEISSAGIDCYLHVGPYFEEITDLWGLLERTEEYISELQIEGINLDDNEEEIMDVIRSEYPDLTESYEKIAVNSRPYEDRLEERVERLREFSDVLIRLFL